MKPVNQHQLAYVTTPHLRQLIALVTEEHARHADTSREAARLGVCRDALRHLAECGTLKVSDRSRYSFKKTPSARRISAGPVGLLIARSIESRFKMTDHGICWAVHCRRCTYAVIVPKPDAGFEIADFDFFRLIQHQMDRHPAGYVKQPMDVDTTAYVAAVEKMKRGGAHA